MFFVQPQTLSDWNFGFIKLINAKRWNRESPKGIIEKAKKRKSIQFVWVVWICRKHDRSLPIKHLTVLRASCVYSISIDSNGQARPLIIIICLRFSIELAKLYVWNRIWLYFSRCHCKWSRRKILAIHGHARKVFYTKLVWIELNSFHVDSISSCSWKTHA